MKKINPVPVVCSCGYDVVKGQHAQDCPMGQFYRLAELRTARRCIKIVERVDTRFTGALADEIRIAFDIEEAG